MRENWDSVDYELYDAIRSMTPEGFKWLQDFLKEPDPEFISVSSSANITQVDEASTKSSR